MPFRFQHQSEVQISMFDVIYFWFSVLFLKVIHQLLLLLEDVLQFSQCGLHLLQRELVLAIARLVLGHPCVQLGDGVVQKHPLLHQGVHLLDPVIGDTLDLGVPHLERGHFGVTLCMGGHLLGSATRRSQDLHVVDGSFVEGQNLGVQGLHLDKVGRFGQTLGGGLLRRDQPGSELLDAGPVLSPELDIVGVFVALADSVGLQVLDKLGDPVKLILEELSIRRNILACLKCRAFDRLVVQCIDLLLVLKKVEK